jgi:hypothetical protein
VAEIPADEVSKKFAPKFVWYSLKQDRFAKRTRWELCAVSDYVVIDLGEKNHQGQSGTGMMAAGIERKLSIEDEDLLLEQIENKKFQLNGR